MKAYISVQYDLFPYFLLFEAEDTGENYKVCDGLFFDYDKIIKRYTKEQWDELEKKSKALIREKHESDQNLKERARKLMS
jgi:hypothetical protein